MKFKWALAILCLTPIMLSANSDGAMATCKPLIHSMNYKRCLETYEHIKAKNLEAQKQAEAEAARKKADEKAKALNKPPTIPPTPSLPKATPKPTPSPSRSVTVPQAKPDSPPENNEATQAPHSQGGFHIDYD